MDEETNKKSSNSSKIWKILGGIVGIAVIVVIVVMATNGEWFKGTASKKAGGGGDDAFELVTDQGDSEFALIESKCGNGVKEKGEECDSSDIGCSSSCKLEKMGITLLSKDMFPGKTGDKANTESAYAMVIKVTSEFEDTVKFTEMSIQDSGNSCTDYHGVSSESQYDQCVKISNLGSFGLYELQYGDRGKITENLIRAYPDSKGLFRNLNVEIANGESKYFGLKGDNDQKVVFESWRGSETLTNYVNSGITHSQKEYLYEVSPTYNLLNFELSDGKNFTNYHLADHFVLKGSPEVTSFY